MEVKLCKGIVSSFFNYSKLGLSYLKRQNSWQLQWLLFATTNDCAIVHYSVCSYNYRSTAKWHLYHRRKYHKILT